MFLKGIPITALAISEILPITQEDQKEETVLEVNNRIDELINLTFGFYSQEQKTWLFYIEAYTVACEIGIRNIHTSLVIPRLLNAINHPNLHPSYFLDIINFLRTIDPELTEITKLDPNFEKFTAATITCLNQAQENSLKILNELLDNVQGDYFKPTLVNHPQYFSSLLQWMGSSTSVEINNRFFWKRIINYLTETLTEKQDRISSIPVTEEDIQLIFSKFIHLNDEDIVKGKYYSESKFIEQYFVSNEKVIEFLRNVFTNYLKSSNDSVYGIADYLDVLYAVDTDKQITNYTCQEIISDNSVYYYNRKQILEKLRSYKDSVINTVLIDTLNQVIVDDSIESDLLETVPGFLTKSVIAKAESFIP